MNPIRNIPNRSKRRRGFTMIEVLLALGLMIWMFAGVYSFYFTAMRVRESSRKTVHDIKLTYGLLSRIATELRYTVDLIPGDGRGFQGTEDRITFITTRIPERYAFDDYGSFTEEQPRAQMDVIRISYALSYDDELEDEETGEPLCQGLWRSVERTIDPNPSFTISQESIEGEFQYEAPDEEQRPMVEGELIAPEIKFIRFQYFDGIEWHDRWHVAFEPEEGEEGFGDELAEGDDGADGGEGDGLGSLDDLGDLAGFDDTEGDSDKIEGTTNEGGYALPQMVRITIGFEPEPQEDLFGDVSDEEFAEDEYEEYHEDRYTMQVYIPTSDPTLLSSRKYGVERNKGEGDEFEVGGQ